MGEYVISLTKEQESILTWRAKGTSITDYLQAKVNGLAEESSYDYSKSSASSIVDRVLVAVKQKPEVMDQFEAVLSAAEAGVKPEEGLEEGVVPGGK